MQWPYKDKHPPMDEDDEAVCANFCQVIEKYGKYLSPQTLGVWAMKLDQLLYRAALIRSQAIVRDQQRRLHEPSA